MLSIQFILHKIQKLTHKAGSERCETVSPAIMVVLALIGVCFIYSAQSYSLGSQWITQLFWLFVGLIVYVAASMINYKIYMEYAHIIYGLGILALLLLWTPWGMKVYGSLRWLNFRFFSIQPSEATKIATLILACSILAREEIKSSSDSLKTLFKTGCVFLVPILLIFSQPDLGSTLVFPPMLFALLYVSKLSKRFFIIVFLIFLFALGLVSWDIYGYSSFLTEHKLSGSKSAGAYEAQAILPLKDYQRNRILSFVAPQVIDPKGTDTTWNLRQSLIAIGSGGLFGKGHNKGTQAKLGYLPQSVAPNDFIFSVLAEEKGFIGALLVLTLYFLLVGNGIRIAGMARDRFGMLLAVGISTIFMVHIFVNIGMTIGVMPITGIPLPFLSYGGSFILSCCFLQGLIQSIYRFRKNYS